jgi:hypothetical protein
MRYVGIIALLSVLLLAACKPEIIETRKNGGKLIIEFDHRVNGAELITDSLFYVNDAGNQYEINEVKYFISDVYLKQNGGNSVHIDEETAIHYTDIDIPSTLTWNVFDTIPEGVYDSISFIFGLNEQRNISFAFVNPPEVNMFWPDILGGGYHYMMINGKWKNPEGTTTPFDFHLGIGQIYSGTTTSVDSITGYVQNYFQVTLPLSALKVEYNSTRTLRLVMNIESWFKTPHKWDFNVWGGYIMQNQEAMQAVKENGYDVFTLEIVQ